MGGAAVAWPLTAHAQQPAIPVIGFLSSRSPGELASVVAAFRQGLRETGFIEGQNFGIAFRWAEGRYDKLPALASELVSLPVTLLSRLAVHRLRSQQKGRPLPYQSFFPQFQIQSKLVSCLASISRAATSPAWP